MMAEVKTLTPIEEINALHSKIEKKKDLYKAVADEYGVSVSTVRINWFHLEIPKDKAARILEIMKTMPLKQRQC